MLQLQGGGEIKGYRGTNFKMRGSGQSLSHEDRSTSCCQLFLAVLTFSSIPKYEDKNIPCDRKRVQAGSVVHVPGEVGHVMKTIFC